MNFSKGSGTIAGRSDGWEQMHYYTPCKFGNKIQIGYFYLLYTYPLHSYLKTTIDANIAFPLKAAGKYRKTLVDEHVME